MNDKIPQTSAGFTLIETIIYIALFALIASTLLTVAVSSGDQDRRTLTQVLNAYENP